MSGACSGGEDWNGTGDLWRGVCVADVGANAEEVDGGRGGDNVCARSSAPSFSKSVTVGACEDCSESG